MFWKCEKASTVPLFNRHKEKLIKENAEAAELMTNIDLKHWSRAYFSTDVKCDSVDNNMSESFNALIQEAKETRYCQIIGNGKDGYEVHYKNEDRFTVQPDEAKCSCMSWDLTGVPCPYAITCIIYEGKDPEHYISDWYTIAKYWRTCHDTHGRAQNMVTKPV
ncbi:hypothetical protein LINGRAHAP2_LOCUS23334 [Linum grandiflorum]